jgi:hypothetical protein
MQQKQRGFPLPNETLGFRTSGAATMACHAFSVKLAWVIFLPLCIRMSRAAAPGRCALQVVGASAFAWCLLPAASVRPGLSACVENLSALREVSAVADGVWVPGREATPRR